MNTKRYLISIDNHAGSDYAIFETNRVIDNLRVRQLVCEDETDRIDDDTTKIRHQEIEHNSLMSEFMNTQNLHEYYDIDEVDTVRYDN